MLLYLVLAACQFKVIHNNQTMDDFKFLCSSTYGHIKSSMELASLIVFARNGDRVPETGDNHSWKKRMCVACRGKTCNLVHCKNGMLTIKGYTQGHKLGSFIKQEYYPRLNKKGTEYINDRNNTIYESFSERNTVVPDVRINGYYYRDERSYAFLKGILESLEYSKLGLLPLEHLGCSKECLGLRNALFHKNDTEKLVYKNEFDRIIGSLCNDVPVDCSRFGCDLVKMEEHLTQERLDFQDNLAKMQESILATAVDFGALSKFILDNESTGSISILSVTSETILALLAGLNSHNMELVPYAAAVFIEQWVDLNGRVFYSAKYNGKRIHIGLFGEEYVEKAEFIKYLKMFSVNAHSVQKICEYKRESIDIKMKLIRGMFNHLIHKLQTKRLLVGEY